MSARTVALATICGLILLPIASAQNPVANAGVVASKAGPDEIKHGASTSVTLTAYLYLDNIVCTEAATVPLALTAAHQPSSTPGIMAHFIPVVNVTIPQGAYASGAAPVPLPPNNSTGETTVHVMVDDTAPGSHNHTITFTATFDSASVGEKCKGAAAIPDASGSATYKLSTPAKEKPVETCAGSACGTATNTTAAAGAKNDTPGFAGPASMLALIAMALLAMRRARKN